MFRIVVLCAIATFIAFPASAKQYYLTNLESDASTATFVDVETVKSVEENKKAAWSISIYEGPKIEHNNKVIKALHYYDCTAHTISLKAYAFYDTNLTSVKESRTFQSYEMTWEDIIPDSNGDVLFNFVCNRTPEMDANIKFLESYTDLVEALDETYTQMATK